MSDDVQRGRTRTERPRRNRRTRIPVLPQLLAAAAELDPARVALRFDGMSLTYAELDARSSQLARALITRGVAPEERVAISIPRSSESVLAVWAVAKTGAAFVPVDPTYPPNRMAHMLVDSGVRFGLTTAAVHDRLPNIDRWLVVDGAELSTEIESYSEQQVAYTDRVAPLRPEHPAWVIYTSGSTGVPKGVEVTHAGIIPLVTEQRRVLGATADSRILHFASPSFDTSLFELLLTIGAGATMVVVPPEIVGGAELVDLVRTERVTHIVGTPSMLATVDPGDIDSVEVALVGGEACPPELVERWGDGGRRRFFNAYGPTEATIINTISPVLAPGDPVTIGGPITGTSAHVLDNRLRPVPTGTTGELFIGGTQVARGYRSMPGLTATRFVADPFGEPGARMYRTGDVVRWTADRDLEYQGRSDQQVKLRGFRVELGEIDAVLSGGAGVDFAVSVVRQLPSGEQALIAYVLTEPGVEMDAGALLELCRTRLAAHMIPTAIVSIDEIPLTPVGKLDRGALPEPVLAAREYRAPETAAQSRVSAVFAGVLGIGEVGLDDDFFELGGNSLIAARVCGELSVAFDSRVPVKLLFEARTVEALAVAIEAQGAEAARVPLVARPRPENVPLSLAQQRMWFLSQFEADGLGNVTAAANNVPVVLRMTGELAVAELSAAIGDVISRHEVLRTIYPADATGRGHQVVLPASAVELELEPQRIAARDLAGALGGQVLPGFDVTASVPLRVKLFQTSDDEYVFVAVAHHIATDGVSLGVLVRDITTAYAARVSGAQPDWLPLPVQYADFAIWQREQLGNEDDPDSLMAAQLAYWREQLRGVPEVLPLPSDRPRPATSSGAGGVFSFDVDAQLHRELEQLALDRNVSLFMLVHAALAVLLARLSSTDDIVIGSPVAGRGEPELDDLVGMFVNTLVLRTRVDSGESLLDMLERIREMDLGAFENADVPFERLVEVLDPVRTAAHHPLFQVALFFQNMAAFQNLETEEFTLPGLAVSGFDPGVSIAKFDLQLTVVPREHSGLGVGMALSWLYAADLFDAATAEFLAESLLRVLRAMVDDPKGAVGDIDLLEPQIRDAILVGRNRTHHDLPDGELLLDRFVAQAAATPERVAIVFGDESLTYAELAGRVNRVGRLLAELGVGPESVVALAMRRSIDLVVGMYGVLAAGGAYLAIDPDHPAERNGYILETAGPACVLTTSRDDFATDGTVVELDTVDLARFDDTMLDVQRPDNATLAYILFTSGSTGRPKGVAVSHGAIANQMAWMRAEYGLNADDIYLQKTATTFDVSLWGYFLPLQVGATLVLAELDGHRDPVYLSRTIGALGVSVTDFVPSLLSVLAAAASPADLGTLRATFVIGEALPAATVDAFTRVTASRVHNLYGPTEAAVSITYADVTDTRVGRPVSIGRPQWNSRVYVLDGRLHPVPDGSPGELYLGGAQLARGYVRRPDLTADRFVADPFVGGGARMYRTGDLVRFDHRGELEYIGRTDFQVKFRGQRIELGEIETALLAQPGVTSAAAQIVATAAGDQLVGYVLGGVDGETVRLGAASALPRYMVPAVVVVLTAFPLNASGKLDRKALPVPVFEQAVFRAARTPIEELVAEVFAEVLGVARVGRDDDFFALGGNSLLATQVVARLSTELERVVGVRALFEAPTVAALADRVESSAGAKARQALTKRERDERVPLSLAQQRMWFLNRYEPESTAYNLPVVLRLDGTLDTAALAAAVGDLMVRHEVLRTRYPESDGVGFQEILPPGEHVLDLRPIPVAEADLTVAVADTLAGGFDVTREVPLRGSLFRISDTEYVLALVVHHIAADGSSLGPMTRDLMVAYTARAAGAAPNFEPLAVQYADYALWQRDVLGGADDPGSVLAGQIGFWRATLAGIPDQLVLPWDRQRPPVQSYSGGRVPVVIDADLHAAMQQLAQQSNTTLFMVLHTAFAVLLARLSGSDDITIGTPIAGRGERALDDLIGQFVNTLVFRSRIDAAAGFATLLAAARETDLDAFAHSDIPFELLVEVLDPPRSAAHHPLFQVGLSFQNLAGAAFALPGLTISGFDVTLDTSQFDLHLIVGDTYDADGAPAGLAGGLTYASALFDEQTAARIAAMLVRILSGLVTEPHRPVGDVAVADTDVLRVAGRGPVQDTSPQTLVDLFGEQVTAGPDRPALHYEGVELTYAEFDACVNRLARKLVEFGVGPEVRVVLAIPRGIELVTAMYAVAAAGGVYVPIDIDQPADRVHYLLELADAALVLVTGDPTEWPGTVIGLDALDLDGYSPRPLDDTERIAPLRPANTAYLLFTSGSTGQPKGVALSHAAVVNQMLWKRSAFELGPGDAVLLKTAATFDLSVWEFWSALVSGATVVIARPGRQQDAVYLDEVMRSGGVTVLHAVPSMLAALATVADGRLAPSVRTVLAIGETLPPELARRLRQANPELRLFNLYGPAETAVSITWHEADDDDRDAVSIGVPETNSRLLVLDSRLHPVPVGVAGELYLAGVQLAYGYHSRPGLSADRFVADPFGAGSRMYRTGDLVAWRAAGGGGYALEYLGRTDFQVKVRGFRIELGEIETQLTAAESVAAAAVSLYHDEHAGDRLVGYVSPAPGMSVDPAGLRSMLAQRLPGYMVPAQLVVLDDLPRNVNGKIDRRALPAPVIEAAEFRAPATMVEDLVASVFAELLGVERVGRDDDFFALGGNSLVATRVVARVGQALDADIAVRTLFEASTVAALAARVESHVGSGARRPLARGSRPAHVPLSQAQQRMWFINQFDAVGSGADEAAGAYNVPVAVRLSGDLDVAALAAAIGDVVDRHEILRTRYPAVDGVGLQEVCTVADVDLDTTPKRTTEHEIAGVIAAEVSAGFDVAVQIPLRVRLFQLASDDYVLVFVAHHIAVDGSSGRPLVADLVVAYTARRQGLTPGWTPLPVQYADYALWQREVLGSAEDPDSLLARQIGYWRSKLAGAPAALELPRDRLRPERPSKRTARLRRRIDESARVELVDAARRTGATLFMAIHAVAVVTFARLSGGRDVVIGTPVAGRGDAALDDLVGMFVNTLALRVEVDPAESFSDLLVRVKDTDVAAFANSDVPFERLVEAINPVRSPAHHPIFQVVLTLQNMPTARFSLPDLVLSGVELDSQRSEMDLTITVGEIQDEAGAADGLNIDFTYATDLFEESEVADLAARFAAVLEGVLAAPGRPVGDIELLDDAERVLAVGGWSTTGVASDACTTIVSLFDAAVAEHAGTVAVRFGAESATYAEVDARSNRLARRLIELGAQSDRLVAVVLPRSVDLVIALLGALKAGAGYLPVDPAYPVDRIQYMLTDARPVAVVTWSRREVTLPSGIDVIEIDTADLSGLSDAPVTDADRPSRLRPDNLAYSIYTSGSTGRPKGVLVPHATVVELFANSGDLYGFGPGDVWTLFHSYAFDFSVWEIWGALLHGGTLVVIDHITSRSPAEFREVVARERVTVLNQTPSAFYQFAAADEAAGVEAAPLSLRWVIFGGEALDLRRLTSWYGRYRGAPRLVNMYGITETTVHVSFRELDEQTIRSATGSVIGRALPGLRVFVLDERLHPVPVGTLGEMYVSGRQLSRGYAGQAALTSGRFVASPFGIGERLYRTGDVARWMRSGELEYSGRSDAQVQLRGFRIELGEVAAALARFEGVAHAVAVVREDADYGDRLVGYVVPQPDVELDAVRVGEFAEQFLTGYMVPDAVAVIDELPLTVNGKLDVPALPAPVFRSRSYRVPTTAIERAVAEAFAGVLGVERVGADDDFFDLGGNSLSATRVASRIGTAVDSRIPVRLLFEDSTVRGIAAAVESLSGKESRPALVPQRRPDHVPLSLAQQRMWFLNRFEPGSPAYNIPLALRLRGNLDVDALCTAIVDVVNRHEVLRTAYPDVDGTGYQVVAPPTSVAVDMATVRTSDVDADLAELFAAAFDVTLAVPLRVRLFVVAPDEHVLALVLHHIAGDGFSIAPLTRDLMMAYAARRRGEAPTWSPLEVQYADYAIWQRRILGDESDPTSLISRQVEHWRAALAGIPASLELPADRLRPAVASYAGAAHVETVDAGVHRELVELARRRGATPFMVVHAALAVLLGRLGATSDVTIGTPIAGRGEAALDDLVGMFVNTLALRTVVDPAESFTKFLARVRESDLAAFSNADVPFERLVEVLSPVRSPSHHPLFQTVLAFQNLERTEFTLGDLALSGVEVDVPVAKFDLQVTVVEAFGRAGEPAGFSLDFTYATALFDADTIAAMCGRFVALLRAITENPDVAVGDIEILTATERVELTDVHGPPGPLHGTLADLLAGAVIDPAKDAVRYGGVSMTYGELDAASNRLARILIALGVGPEDAVAVAIPRSTDYVLAVWAVVKSGAAFLPVDPAHPVARIEHMVTDSAARMGLTTSDLIDRLPTAVAWTSIDGAEFGELTGDASDAPVDDRDRVRSLTPEHPAYVIYTSGTTGLPKGVVVRNAGAVNYCAAQIRRYGLTSANRPLYLASPSFDASVLEFLMAVGTGATLIVAPVGVFGGHELAELIRRERVTHMFCTPTALATVDAANLPDLVAIGVGGEAVPRELVARWAVALPGGAVRAFVNVYGPTETTIASNLSDPLLPDAPVVLGPPVLGMSLLVLDERLQPVPVGVAGELYIAGPQLARGYRGRGALTAERFVAHPFGDGARMYRSGDLARWVRTKMGLVVEYVGRADFQVKVRGFRIELGEIEAALLGQDGIRQAAAIVREDAAGIARIVAYVVPEPGVTLDPPAILAQAASFLAEYMVPSAAVVLDAMPLGPTGKLDRSALPAPTFTSSSFVAPISDLERIVADVFADVLGLERVGVDDSFFALGGDSIMSIQVVSRAKLAGVVISPRDVFEAKTVRALAERAVTLDSTDVSVTLAELPGGGVGWLPLTPIARFMVERPGGYGRFMQKSVLELPAGIDRESVVATLSTVVDHHDMLRSRLVSDERGWGLDVGEPGTVDVDALVRQIEVDPATEWDRVVELASWELDFALDTLDPAGGVMMAFVWLDFGSRRSGRLIVVLHHLVVDGVSWRVLVPDLVSAWMQFAAGQVVTLEPVGTSMRRWAHAVAEDAVSSRRRAELPYWRAVLAGQDPLLGTRALDPAVDVESTTATVRVEVPADVTDALLTAVPRQFRGGVNDGLLAGLALATARLRHDRGVAESSLLLQLEGHGREDVVVAGADVGRTVGWFTATFPVRLDLAGIDLGDAFGGGPDVGRAVKLVKEQLLAVPDKGLGFGELRYLDAEGREALRGFAGPQVSFNYLGRFGTGALPDDLRALSWLPASDFDDVDVPGEPDMPMSAVIDINAITTADAAGSVLAATFKYVPAIVDDETVATYASLWVQALTAVATHVRRPGAGGLTPSDVPLVAVTPADLERFESRFAGVEDVWPLAPLQSGLLFHAMLAESSVDQYSVQMVLSLSGAVDAGRLRAAAQAVLDRYPNLRTAFMTAADGSPVQVVLDGVEVGWRELDLSDEPDPENSFARAAAADRAARWDLSAPPLIRFTLVRLTEQRYRLILANHHIVLDGWSMPLLVRDLLALYASRGNEALLPRVRSYRHYLAWVAAQDRDASLTVWRNTLAGLAEPTLLAPTTRARQSNTLSESLIAALDEPVTASLTRLAGALGVTVNTIVQVVWSVFLGRMSGQDDVVFGATVSGRPPQLGGVESMVGLFINTLPVRVRLDSDETVTDALVRVQNTQADLLDHHYLGLSDIQRVGGPGVGFDTLVVFESYPVDREGLAEQADALDGMVIDGLDVASSTNYPLALLATAGREIHLKLRYLPDCFDSAYAQQALDRVASLLRQVATDPGRRIGDLDVLSTSDRALLRSTSSGPTIPLTDDTLIDMFDRQVGRTPDSVAVVGGGVTLTYAEFDARVNRLARHLITLGVGPESLVALAVRRSVELVIGMYAIVKAGGAYVPVDPDQPESRNSYVLDTADPVCVLTTRRDGFAASGRWPVVEVDLPESAGADSPVTDAERRRPLRPANTVYVLFTSGSTGRPKGVALSHRSVVNHANWRQSAHRYDAADAVLQRTPFTFDASVREFWWPLLFGARLVMATPDGHRDPAYLAAMFRAHKITATHFVPSMLTAFATVATADDVASLRYISCGGETMSPKLYGELRSLTDADIRNEYGPTEATVTVARSGPLGAVDRSVPFGGPVPNMHAYVLDSRLRTVPIGAPGELYLAGAQLATCYVGRPDLTADRFVADPHRAGHRMYRTGDLVRWTSDRQLEFLGRTDFQVKLRGLRIELGEVEAALLRAESVDQAVVVHHEDSTAGEHLVAYVVPSPGARVDTPALRDEVARHVPSYMVPTGWMILDRFPSTASGKVDRRALPAPAFETREFVAPRTELEELVAGVFADLLGLDRVGRDDDFFGLGGNSLSVMALTAQLGQRLGVAVPVRVVFLAPRVADLAERIALGRRVGFESDLDEAIRVIVPLRRGSATPVFCVHPMIGLAWTYTALVPYLNREVAVFGVQTPVLTDDGPVPDSLTAYIERYAREVDAAQPHGPMRILGWSLGGVLAHGVAVRLQEMGRDVASLIVLDARPEPADVGGEGFAGHLRGELVAMGVPLGAEETLADLSPESLAAIFAAIDGEQVAFTPSRLRRVFEGLAASRELARAYRPGVFAGDMVFVQSTDEQTADAPQMWQPYVTGEIDVHHVDADHVDMMNPDALRTVGPIVAAALGEEGDRANDLDA